MGITSGLYPRIKLRGHSTQSLVATGKGRAGPEADGGGQHTVKTKKPLKSTASSADWIRSISLFRCARWARGLRSPRKLMRWSEGPLLDSYLGDPRLR